MPVRPDMPCADCGTLMWRSSTSLPAGQARCQPCRRLRPTVPRERATDAWCEACGQQITARQASRYCSVKCAKVTINRARSKGGSRAPRNCPTCDEVFTPTGSRQITCSRTCKRPRVLRCRVPDDHPARWVGDCSPVTYSQCAWCERTTVIGPTGSAAAKRVYCSAPCRWKAKAVRRRSVEAGTYGFWSLGRLHEDGRSLLLVLRLLRNQARTPRP